MYRYNTYVCTCFFNFVCTTKLYMHLTLASPCDTETYYYIFMCNMTQGNLHSVCIYVHVHVHTHTCPSSKTFKKLTGVYDGQIRSGRTAVDMPALQLATLQRSVMASCTGPCGGLCQLDPEKDSPTHDRGTCVYR